MHTKGVGIEFYLGDGSPGFPEVGKDGQAGDTAESEFRVSEAAEVVNWDGGNDLIAKGFVGLSVGAEGGLIVVEKTVDFGDGGGSGGNGMNGLARTVDRGYESDAAGTKKVRGGREGEGQMAMDAVAFVRWDSDGVTVELGLG